MTAPFLVGLPGITARAGVPGLSPRQVRFRALENGWGALPILQHDADDKGAGKRPVLSGWEAFAEFDADLPTLADLNEWDARFPYAPGTGLPLGNQVAIDLDFLRDPTLAQRAYDIAVTTFGETPFVRQGQTPKTALVYRAAEPIETVRLKTANGDGDGVDILGDGAQLVAFGIHPNTLEPYRWIGAASPLTGTPHDAPEITNEQIQTFLGELGRFVDLTSAAGPRNGRNGGGGGGDAAIVRNAEGLVVDGRERWLTSAVFRIACAMHRNGGLDVDILANHSWAAFAETTVLADGKWTPRDAHHKAMLLVRRVKAGKINLDGLKLAEPTYADRAQPVELARRAVETAVRNFLRAAVTKPAPSPLGLTIAATTSVIALRIATGTGKTTIAARMIAEMLRAHPDLRFLYCVPTHRLGDNIVADFARHGVTAKVFRGRKAPDPDRPGKTMCGDLAAVEIALDLGEYVESSCCKGQHPATKAPAECPFYSRCSYQDQKVRRPSVWVVAHEMLFIAQEALGTINAIFVDEAFWQDGIWESRRGLTLDEIGTPLPLATGFRRTQKDENADEVETYRKQLHRALCRQTEPGGVRRRYLAAEGLTAETCSSAISAEWRLKGEPEIWPGMPAAARRAVAKTARGAKHVQAFTNVWTAARALLNAEDDAAVSGRLWFGTTETDEGTVRTVRTRGVKAIVDQWHVPAILMDATLPGLEILRAFYPQLEVVDDIDVTMPFAKVRQVLSAPVSTRRLFTGRKDAFNLSRFRRYILRRWIETGRQSTVVICQQAVEQWLKASGLPASIAVEHFNAIAGLDQYKDVRLLISIGRTQPGPDVHEADAGALVGVEPVKAAIRDNGSRWFNRVERGIRMADGTGRAVTCDQHPDPVCEALRQQICESEIMQSVGRARGVNRTAATPVDIDIVGDVVLPITVDEVRSWEAEDVGGWTETAAAGVILESPSAMARAFPAIWPNLKAAKRDPPPADLRDKLLDRVPYQGVWAGNRATSPWRVIAYRPPARGQQTRHAAFDPAIVPDPRAWLTERLGPLAHFEVEAPSPSEKQPDPPDAAHPAADEQPTPSQPEDATMDDVSGLEGLWRKPMPEPAPPEAEPRFRLRMRCRPPPAGFECVACDPPLPLPIERGRVAGISERSHRRAA